MGVSWAQLGSLNAAQAARLGVLPAAQHAVADGAGRRDHRRPSPRSSGRTGTRARAADRRRRRRLLARVPDGDRPGRLARRRRPTASRLEPACCCAGPGGLPDTSVLLDGTPGAAAGWDADLQAALPVGAAVPVSGGDFSVVVQSVSAAGAVVTVTPGPAGAPRGRPPRRRSARPAGCVHVGRRRGRRRGPRPPAAATRPATFWAPVYSGAAHPSDTVLRERRRRLERHRATWSPSPVRSLAGATLLLVRRLRAARLR